MTSRTRTPARRRRLLVLATVGMVLSAPLLAGPTAAAQPAGPTDTVTFRGGCGLLGLGASSQPDPAEVRVESGTALHFANRLGHSAVLAVNDQPATEVADGAAALVTFHDGPATVTMRIKCLLGEPSGAVTVEVAQVAGATPAPTVPASPARDGSAGSDTRSGAAGSGPGGSGTEGEPPDQQPQAQSGAGQAPGTARGATPGWAGTRPSPGAVPPESHRPAGPPPDGVPVDGPMSAPGGDGDLSAGWDLGGDPGTESSGPAATDGPTEFTTLSGSGPPDRGAIGLLALIATVCVVGVSAGAVRAILSQRTNQSETA